MFTPCENLYGLVIICEISVASANPQKNRDTAGLQSHMISEGWQIEREQYLFMGPEFNIYMQGLVIHSEVKIRISEIDEKHTITVNV